MKITIDGLPEGQKIKHISVDISFDDTDECTVKSTVDKPTWESFPNTPGVTDDFNPRDEVIFEEIGHPSVDISERPKKEIPPEMQDMEF